jgi:hypothetical protein
MSGEEDNDNEMSIDSKQYHRSYDLSMRNPVSTTSFAERFPGWNWLFLRSRYYEKILPRSDQVEPACSSFHSVPSQSGGFNL